MSADSGGVELALQVDADVVSRDQGDVGQKSDQWRLEGNTHPVVSANPVVVGQLDDDRFTAFCAEFNPAVDVAVCVLLSREDFVVPAALPFGGGETGECESVAQRGVIRL